MRLSVKGGFMEVPKMVGVIMFDGSCWPNPGGNPSCAWTFGIHEEGEWRNSHPTAQGRVKVPERDHGGHRTNNVAEYAGLVYGMEWVVELCEHVLDKLLILGDSQVVIKCVQKDRAHHASPHLAKWHTRARAVLARVEEKWPTEFRWVSRAQNVDCDALSRV